MRAWRNTYILCSINQKLPLTVRSNIIIQLVSALYPPQLWAWEPDADEDDVPRTTNVAEAFHKHMKDLFNSPRPNLYLFAFKLLQLQEETYHYVCQPAESALLAQAGEINWREQTMCLTSVNSTNTCICHGWNMSDLWLSNICQLIARTGRTPTA